jgi:outer membrane protein assembly factor BamA
MLPRVLTLSAVWYGLFLSLDLAHGWAQTKAPVKAGKTTVPVVQTPAVPGKYPLREIHVTGNQNLTETQVVSACGLQLNQLAAKQDIDAAKDRLVATGMFETIGYRFGPSGDGYAVTFEIVEVPTLFPVQFENLPEPAGDIEVFLRSRSVMYGPKIPGTTQVIDYYARLIAEFLASRNHAGNVVGQLVQTGKDQFKVTYRTSDPPPPVTSVTFTGNKEIIGVKLQNAINDVAFGMPFRNDAFRLLLDHQIRALYDARGMLRVSFPEFTTEPDPKLKGVIVHVTVVEGPVYTLNKVTVASPGTPAEADLVKTANIQTDEEANFDLVNEGLNRVREALKRAGYMKADGEVERKLDDKARTVEVVLRMEKGPLYKFGKLTIQGLDLNGEPVVRKMWGVSEGKPFNALYPDLFLKRVREDGVFDGLGETKAKTDIDEGSHVVDVTLIFGATPKAAVRRRER